MGLELLRVTRYALAQHFLALAQAVDLCGGETKLSPQTAPLYRFVRERAKYVAEERPLHTDIESIYETFVTGEFGHVVRNRALGGIE